MIPIRGEMFVADANELWPIIIVSGWILSDSAHPERTAGKAIASTTIADGAMT